MSNKYDICLNMNCGMNEDERKTEQGNWESFKECAKGECTKRISFEEMALHACLRMAQQSFTPDLYDNFIPAYNLLIDLRKLNLKKIDY